MNLCGGFALLRYATPIFIGLLGAATVRLRNLIKNPPPLNWLNLFLLCDGNWPSTMTCSSRKRMGNYFSPAIRQGRKFKWPHEPNPNNSISLAQCLSFLCGLFLPRPWPKNKSTTSNQEKTTSNQRLLISALIDSPSIYLTVEIAIWMEEHQSLSRTLHKLLLIRIWEHRGGRWKHFPTATSTLLLFLLFLASKVSLLSHAVFNPLSLSLSTEI